MFEFGFLLDKPEPREGSPLYNKYHQVKSRQDNSPPITALYVVYSFLDRLRTVDMNGQLIPITLSNIKDAAEMYGIKNVSNLIYMVTMIDSWARAEHSRRMEQKNKGS